MPRKTGLQAYFQKPRTAGFNEAAARCRGKLDSDSRSHSETRRLQ